MEERDLENAGLYDPAAPDATERRELLDFLVGHGATVDQMRAADEAGRLPSLAGDLVARPGHERLTVTEAADRLGVDTDRVRRVMLAAGLTIDLDDPHPLTSGDVAAIESFEAGAQLLGDDAALAFTRLLGNAAARVAEAAVEIFALEVAVGLDAEASAVDHSRASAELASLTRLVPYAFDDLLHQHLRRSARRSLDAAVEHEPNCVHTTIGFVDLVGSTAWTRGLTQVELARALMQFEAAAFDIASAHGGWVVKLIGDAAMFEARDPVVAARIGLDLCHAVDECVDLPSARGGLAAGLVQARAGDFFGTVVNLAARAASVSEPCTLAVNDVVAEHVTNSRHVAGADAAADRFEDEDRSGDDGRRADPFAEVTPTSTGSPDLVTAWSVDPMPAHDLHGFNEPPPLYRLSRV